MRVGWCGGELGGQGESFWVDNWNLDLNDNSWPCESLGKGASRQKRFLTETLKVRASLLVNGTEWSLLLYRDL